MSKRLPPQLTDRLEILFGGAHLEQQWNQALLLVTLDEAGWPYVSMLSYFEVIAKDRSNLRIAPWSTSTAAKNLRRAGKATLIVVEEEIAYYLQASATELAAELPGFPGMAKFNLHVESILEDKALDYEGAARITTGVRYENPQIDAAYIARGRRILDALGN